MRLTMFTCAAVLMAAPAFAQDEAARRVATEVAARVPLERAIKGAPYSAETLVEGMQLLADGNRITRKTTGRVYRDSEGRTRREDDRPNGGVTISITDPVAGYSYSLDPANKVAWRTPMGAAGAIMSKVEDAQAATRANGEWVSADGRRVIASGSAAPVEERRRVEETEAARRGGSGGSVAAVAPTEVPVRGGGRGGAVARTGVPAENSFAAGPVEHKVIDGIAVEGRKSSRVIPAGAVGNEQPITVVSEQWRSPDLNVLVMTRHSDPRSGDSTYRLLNVVRAEPDRSLFMVPGDYTVRDTGVRRMLESSRRD